MSVTVIKETVDYTWVVARQLDRIASAASSVDTSARLTMRETLLKYYYMVRQLVTLVRPLLGLTDEVRNVLNRVLKELHRDNADLIEIYDVLDEIESMIIEGLMKRGLLIKESKLKVEE